jgi:hypothetical protein
MVELVGSGADLGRRISIGLALALASHTAHLHTRDLKNAYQLANNT